MELSKLKKKYRELGKSRFTELCSDLARMLDARADAYGSHKEVADVYRLFKIAAVQSCKVFDSEYCHSSSEIMALDMVLLKIARILTSGRSSRIDSWRDIAGYAILALESLSDGENERAEGTVHD